MAKQLSVFLQNEPGKIAAVCRILAGAGIDLRAISIADTADFGILRLLTDDWAKAKQTLSGSGYVVSETEVTVVAVPDVPGGLSGVLDLLSDNGLGIEYMYSLFGRGANHAYMVFRVSEDARLRALLAENGIDTVGADQLGMKE